MEAKTYIADGCLFVEITVDKKDPYYGLASSPYFQAYLREQIDLHNEISSSQFGMYESDSIVATFGFKNGVGVVDNSPDREYINAMGRLLQNAINTFPINYQQTFVEKLTKPKSVQEIVDALPDPFVRELFQKIVEQNSRLESRIAAIEDALLVK